MMSGQNFPAESFIHPDLYLLQVLPQGWLDARLVVFRLAFGDQGEEGHS